VGVEKLAQREFAEIASRQEALQTILPKLLDIFYHPIFDFFFGKTDCTETVSRRFGSLGFNPLSGARTGLDLRYHQYSLLSLTLFPPRFMEPLKLSPPQSLEGASS
jgi:hypothetical protein